MKISLLDVLKESNQGYVNEQGAGQLIKGFAGDAKAFKTAKPGVFNAFVDVLAFAKNDKNQIVGLTAKSPNKAVVITNVDDLLHALRVEGGMASDVLAKFNQGLLKSSKTPTDLIDGITKEVVGSKNFVSKYGKLTDGDMRKALKAAGYSDGAVESFMKNAKKNPSFKKSFDRAKLKRTAGGKNKNMSPKGNGSNVPAGQKKTLRERANEIINMIKVKKMSWKELSLWAAGIGITAFALWWFLYDSDDVIPEDTPETEPGDTTEWAPCIKELLDSGEGTIMQVGVSNLTVVRVVTPEYPEGLNFVSNGRVADIKTKKMGTWKCKDGEVKIQSESKKTSLTGSLNEQGGKIGLSKIDIKWDGQNQSDEKITNPINKSKYHDCSGKDTFEFGCKSPKIKEIQICLGMEEKYHTGNFGPLTKKALEDMSYDTSQGITIEIYNRIKSTCKDNSNVRPSRLDNANIEPLKTNKIPLAPVNTDNLKLPNLQPINQGNRGEKIYNLLKGNFETRNEEGNENDSYIFQEGNRIKYKGDALSQENLDVLTSYISNELGYDFMKAKSKDDYEFKYVWLKR